MLQCIAVYYIPISNIQHEAGKQRNQLRNSERVRYTVMFHRLLVSELTFENFFPATFSMKLASDLVNFGVPLSNENTHLLEGFIKRAKIMASRSGSLRLENGDLVPGRLIQMPARHSNFNIHEIDIHISKYLYIYICVHIYIICTCMYTYVYTYTYTYIHKYINIYVYTYMCRLYIYMYMCIYICTHKHI